MMTRRTSLGLGLGAAAVCVTGLAACGPTSSPRLMLGPIDALLLDRGVDMPKRFAALIVAHRQTYPALEVKLDAENHTRLTRILNTSQTLVGLSSGATLFCLEHMARDHGFRLTARCQQSASEDACLPEMADLLRGVLPVSSSQSTALSPYRPSRADDILHAWVMQKSSQALRLPLREI